MSKYSMLMNRYAQGKISLATIVNIYVSLSSSEQTLFETELYDLIHQSRCTERDITTAAMNSRIKTRSTQCVIAEKGLFYANVVKICKLPDKDRSVKFLLELFKIGYLRRKAANTKPSKWWYQDIE